MIYARPALKLAVGCCLAAVYSATSIAAPADSAAKSGASAAAADELQEVTVVARRVDERQLTVPVTVNVLSSDDIERKMIRTTKDLSFVVPGLTINQGTFSNVAFNIRGTGSTASNNTPGVVSYIAEVPQALYGAQTTLIDLQSVQVLKGPQGTLFGKNSIGGAVLFVPQRPTDEFQGSVTARVGNFETREITGTINLPVNDVWSVRLAGRYTKQGALVDNIAGPDLGTLNRGAARLSVLFKPNDHIENYFMANGFWTHEYSDLREIPTSVGSCPSSPIVCAYGFLGLSFDAALAEQDSLGKDKAAVPVIEKSKFNQKGVTNHTTFDLGPVSLKNIVAYHKFRDHQVNDVDGFRLDLISTDTPLVHKQLTEELQLRSAAGGRLDWVVGGFYSDNKDYTNDGRGDVFGELSGFPGVPASPTITDSLIRSKSKAAFAQGTFALVDALKLTLGIRRTKDDIDFRGSSFSGTRDISACRNVSGGEFLPGTDPATCIRSVSQAGKKTTWNANLEYEVSPDFFAYVTSRYGYKQGGFNATASSSALLTFGPETLHDYEVGLKNEGHLGGMAYRANVAAYTARYKGIQGDITAIDNGAFGVFIQNAGGAKINGAEFEGALLPLPGLEFGMRAAYTDGKYDKDMLLTTYQDKGVLNTPKVQFGLDARYGHDLGEDLGTLVLSGNFNYTGKQPVNYNNVTFGSDPRYQRIGGFGMLDTTIEWRKIGGSRIDATVYAQNLTDKRAPIYVFDIRDTVGYAATAYARPRMYGLELTANF